MDLLKDVRVVEFSHMVMGPATGMILGDLGADVVKVEPPGGDKTRQLPGSGAGYFLMFNRNKKSIALDLRSADGIAIARDLIAGADVVIENFRTGAMDKLGLGPDDARALNPRIIYHSCKGFLSGPYEHRTALDEVAQMMGGLAYMTGPSGRPLRAGSSVIDIAGAMFGVIGILAALHRRDREGEGAQVTSALYETVAFLVGQHMAQQAVTGKPAPPMPERTSAWAVYDVFDARDGQIFVGVVSDGQWRAFCEAFGLDDWCRDEALSTNSGRVAHRDTIIPRVRSLFATESVGGLSEKLEASGLPHAPIRRPEDLTEDPHLSAGGLVDLTLPDTGMDVRLPNLPIELNSERATVRRDVPAAGRDAAEILDALGYDAKRRAALIEQGIVG